MRRCNERNGPNNKTRDEKGKFIHWFYLNAKYSHNKGKYILWNRKWKANKEYIAKSLISA